MRFLPLLFIAVFLLALSGCGNPSIDVARANKLVQSDGRGTPVSIDVLIKEFGEPNSITSAQKKKLKKVGEMLHPNGAPERNYDNAKVWGDNKSFIVVYTNDDGTIRGHTSIGGNARPRPKRD